MAQTDTRMTSQVTAAGIALIEFRVANGIGTWKVQQVSTEMGTAPIGATCEIRKNGAPVTPMIATGDVAGGDPPVTLLAQDVMTIRWAGCTPGDVGTATIFYDDGRPE